MLRTSDCLAAKVWTGQDFERAAIVRAYIVMAYIVMALVIAYIVMAYIVMARVCGPCRTLSVRAERRSGWRS